MTLVLQRQGPTIQTVEVLETQHLDCVVDVRVVFAKPGTNQVILTLRRRHRRVKKASEP